MTEDTSRARELGRAHYDKGQPEWLTVREIMANAYGEDWQRTGPSETFDIENNYNTDHKDVMIIRGTGNNDVHGYDDAVSVSNYRVLCQSWSDLGGFSRGPWSNIDYIALELDSEAPADLVETLESLSDYPVLDEQERSDVEQEMIQEHWDRYGKNDVLDTVAKAIGLDNRTDLTDAAEEIAELLVWDGVLDYGYGEGYPTMIDPSACDFGDASVAKFFKEHIGTIVTVKRYGVEEALDLRRENIIRTH